MRFSSSKNDFSPYSDNFKKGWFNRQKSMDRYYKNLDRMPAKRKKLWGRFSLIPKDEVFTGMTGNQYIIHKDNTVKASLTTFFQWFTVKKMILFMFIIFFALGGIYSQNQDITLQFSREYSTVYSEIDSYDSYYTTYSVNFPQYSNKSAYLYVNESATGMDSDMVLTESPSYIMLEEDYDNCMYTSDDFTSHDNPSLVTIDDNLKYFYTYADTYWILDNLSLTQDPDGADVSSYTKQFDSGQDEYVYYINLAMASDSNIYSRIYLIDQVTGSVFLTFLFSEWNGLIYAYRKNSGGSDILIDTYSVANMENQIAINYRWVNRTDSVKDTIFYNIHVEGNDYNEIVETYTVTYEGNLVYPNSFRFYTPSAVDETTFYIYSMFASETMNEFNFSLTEENTYSEFTNISCVEYDLFPNFELHDVDLDITLGNLPDNHIMYETNNTYENYVDYGSSCDEIDTSYLNYTSNITKIKRYDFVVNSFSYYQYSYKILDGFLRANYNLNTTYPLYYLGAYSNNTVLENTDGSLFVDTSKDTLCNITVFLDDEFTVNKVKTFQYVISSTLVKYYHNLTVSGFSDVTIVTAGYSFVDPVYSPTHTTYVSGQNIYVYKNDSWWKVICVHIYSTIAFLTNPYIVILGIIAIAVLGGISKFKK